MEIIDLELCLEGIRDWELLRTRCRAYRSTIAKVILHGQNTQLSVLSMPGTMLRAGDTPMTMPHELYNQEGKLT